MLVQGNVKNTAQIKTNKQKHQSAIECLWKEKEVIPTPAFPVSSQ